MIDLISLYEVAVTVRVCGILECHVRVNPNSLLKMEIETQSSVALNLSDCPRPGSTEGNEEKKG